MRGHGVVWRGAGNIEATTPFPPKTKKRWPRVEVQLVHCTRSRRRQRGTIIKPAPCPLSPLANVRQLLEAILPTPFLKPPNSPPPHIKLFKGVTRYARKYARGGEVRLASGS